MANKREQRIEEYVANYYSKASRALKTHAYLSYATGMNDERKIIINHIRRNIKKYITITDDNPTIEVNKLINDINRI